MRKDIWTTLLLFCLLLLLLLLLCFLDICSLVVGPISLKSLSNNSDAVEKKAQIYLRHKIGNSDCNSNSIIICGSSGIRFSEFSKSWPQQFSTADSQRPLLELLMSQWLSDGKTPSFGKEVVRFGDVRLKYLFSEQLFLFINVNFEE